MLLGILAASILKNKGVEAVMELFEQVKERKQQVKEEE